MEQNGFEITWVFSLQCVWVNNYTLLSFTYFKKEAKNEIFTSFKQGGSFLLRMD
jgi:hypothetical protein